jgi:aromatic-L-amino-acid decarboxylase
MSKPELGNAPIDEDRTLELSGDELSSLVSAAMARISAYIDSLPEQPAFDVDGAEELARSLVEPLPESGEAFEELLGLLFEEVVPRGFGTAVPGYLAYIPGGGIPQSAIGDLIAEMVNRYTSIWLPAPGLAQIEAVAIRWLCEMVGYPAGARGLLTTGGSMANFIGLVTARRERLPEDFLGGTIYVSDQAHHCVQKGAMLAGFPVGNIRTIPSDARFHMRLDVLEKRIAEDREAGHTPFLVIASGGTVNTGAVDDLATIADLAEREEMWLHVDAAYGGFFVLTERGRHKLAGIERADSIVLDPHKGLFLPYGTGSLLVRDGAALKRAHTVSAGYLPEMQTDPDFLDFAEMSPELSRDHRGLRVWLPIKMHGIEPFRRNLDEKLDLARWATDQLRAIPGMEIAAEPELSLVAFRLVRPRLSDAELNRMNQEILEAVNARRRVYLSGTLLDGVYLLRICVLSFRTHLADMRHAVDDIRAAIEDVSPNAP